MKPQIFLRPLEIADLRTVARVHMRAFPDSALTRLGPHIVELYYLWQLTGPHENVRAVAAVVADKCAGFSISGIFKGSTSGFIRSYRAPLIKAVLRHPRNLLNPLFRERLKGGVRLLARLARKRKPANVEEVKSTPNYGILSIAVDPQFQKLGIGQMLMKDAEIEALKYGYHVICLTVHPSNTNAVRFYERMKWKRTVTGNIWQGSMIKTLR